MYNICLEVVTWLEHTATHGMNILLTNYVVLEFSGARAKMTRFWEIFVDPPPIFKHFSKFHDFYITHCIMKLYSYILLHSLGPESWGYGDIILSHNTVKPLYTVLLGGNEKCTV